MSNAAPLRVLAILTFQYDLNGYIYDSLERAPVEIDVTDALLAMTYGELMRVKDDQLESDDLPGVNEARDAAGHTGPFRVEVESSRDNFLEAHGIEDAATWEAFRTQRKKASLESSTPAVETIFAAVQAAIGDIPVERSGDGESIAYLFPTVRLCVYSRGALGLGEPDVLLVLPESTSLSMEQIAPFAADMEKVAKAVGIIQGVFAKAAAEAKVKRLEKSARGAVAGDTLIPWGFFPKSWDFKRRVGVLRRPYVAITNEEYAVVEAHPSKCDLFELPCGTIVTFGDADGGKAIMPADPECLVDCRRFVPATAQA